MRKRFLATLAALAFTTGPAMAEETVLLHAAGSLRGALTEVARSFEAAGLGHIKMAVGGAPISQMFADEIGADGYGANASAAVDLFLRLVGRR